MSVCVGVCVWFPYCIMNIVNYAHLCQDWDLDWVIPQAANVNVDNRLTSPTWYPMDRLMYEIYKEYIYAIVFFYQKRIGGKQN